MHGRKNLRYRFSFHTPSVKFQLLASAKRASGIHPATNLGIPYAGFPVVAFTPVFVGLGNKFPNTQSNRNTRGIQEFPILIIEFLGAIECILAPLHSSVDFFLPSPATLFFFEFFRSLLATDLGSFTEETLYLFLSISVIYFRISFVRTTFIISNHLDDIIAVRLC
jgi:hypothetical protein